MPTYPVQSCHSLAQSPSLAPMALRIKHRLLYLAFKALHKLAPSCLSSCILTTSPHTSNIYSLAVSLTKFSLLAPVPLHMLFRLPGNFSAFLPPSLLRCLLLALQGSAQGWPLFNSQVGHAVLCIPYLPPPLSLPPHCAVLNGMWVFSPGL